MKRLILSIALGLTVTASAQQFQYRSFLGPNVAVQITNNVTYTYGDTNIWFTNSQGQAVMSLTSYYSTNGFGTSQGYYYTNANAGYGQAWYDVPSFADRNGNNASITFSVGGTSTAKATNSHTFTLVKLLKSTGVPQELSIPVTQAGSDALKWAVGVDYVVMAFTNTPSSTVVVATNLPAAFVQGAAGFRLLTVVSANGGAAANFNLTSAGIGGWVP